MTFLEKITVLAQVFYAESLHNGCLSLISLLPVMNVGRGRLGDSAG